MVRVDGGQKDEIYQNFTVQNLTVSGTETIASSFTTTGDTTLGDASSDNLTIVAQLAAAFNLNGQTLNSAGIIAFQNGGSLQSSTTSGHTYKFQVRDIDGAAWVDAITLTAANNPTLTVGAAMSGFFILGQTTGNYTLTWADPAASRAISIADPGGTDTFAWLAATQAITNKTYNGLTITSGTGTLTIPSSKTISFADAFTTSGAFPITFTVTGSTSLTLPTSGTVVATAGSLVIASGKTFTVNNTLTLAGTDGQTFTFPAVSDTVAALGTAQTFTAAQTVALGTITTDVMPLNLTATYNNAGTTFTGMQISVTNTASNGASAVFTTKHGGTTRFQIIASDGQVNITSTNLWGVKQNSSYESSVSRSAGSNLSFVADGAAGGIAIGTNSDSHGERIRINGPRSANGIAGGGTARAAILNQDIGTYTFTTTAQTGDVYGYFLGQVTLANPSSGTIANAYGMSLAAPQQGTNVSITTAVGLLLGSALTQASAAATQYNALQVPAHTLTLTGTTTVTTSSGLVHLGQLTITDSSAVTVNNYATLYIAGAPVAGGSVTLTTPLSLWVDAGNARFDGNILIDTIAENTAATGVTIDGLLIKDGTTRGTVQSKTGTYTMVDGDRVVLATAGAGGWTLTLLTAAGRSGVMLSVKKVDSAAGSITIDASGSETIDGALTYVLDQQFESVTIVSDGTNWQVV